MEKDFIFGIHPVSEAIAAGRDIDKILLQRQLNSEQARDLLQQARAHNIPVNRVPVEKLNRITRKNHQGVICFLSPVSFASLDEVISSAFATGRDPIILVLDRVSDVRNFGAIVRTAECAGVSAVLVPEKGSSAINADAVKTSAGALNYLPVCRVSDLSAGLRFLRNSGLVLVGLTEKAGESLFDLRLTGPLALLLGSEEDGIQPEYLKLCDHLAALPIRGRISSLNVSVAAAVSIYEAMRQRQLK